MTILRVSCVLACFLLQPAVRGLAEDEVPVPAKKPPVEDEVTTSRDTDDDRGPPESEADALPLWELGIGGGIGWTPDYPAAGQNHFRGLALPFARYRGEFFQADGGSARGIFVNTGRVEVDISLAGSLPADSDDNDAREGLDDLDYLGEIGPRISYFFDRDQAGNERRFDVALRAVLSTDFSSNFDYVGLIFHPYYAQEMVDVGGIDDLDAAWSIGARWADEGVMDLFYEVDADEANADRAAFDAKGGYLGANIYGAVSYPFTDHLKLAFAANLANYYGAENSDSDLFIDDWNIGFGLGVIITLWKSETLSKERRCVENDISTLACPG